MRLFGEELFPVCSPALLKDGAPAPAHAPGPRAPCAAAHGRARAATSTGERGWPRRAVPTSSRRRRCASTATSR